MFEAVWKLVAPSEWEEPKLPEINTEEDLDTGRIDIVIRSNDQRNRIVGIEVKTVEESTKKGQLARYLGGLKAKYPKAVIAMAYLTPFNKKRVEQLREGEAVKPSPAVREFKEFSKTFTRSRHASWLDVAAIPWDGNALWEQHRKYVCNHISAPKELHRNRALDVFFGPEPAQTFMDALEQLEVQVDGLGADIDIELKNYKDRLPWLAEGLVKALHTLVNKGDGVSRNLRSPKKDTFRKHGQYCESPFSEVHKALFGLADRNANVWVRGTKNYGVVVAHKTYKGGVSLIRSMEDSKLRISGGR